jgi:cellulose synthase/poly-beta-1,6-N-acetylglucosamine synthase-like glycosyltransferase
LAAGLFWMALALVAYTYGGYLLVLVAVDAVDALRRNAAWLAAPGERRRATTAPELPRVTVLIAAYNEESCLREKLENTLALAYPADRLEILVGSDGSTDATDAIVTSFAARGVRLSAAPRGGKVAVLNRLTREATGTLWLFTDANTMLEPDALCRLVDRARDPWVGGVSGRLRLVAPEGGVAGEGAYWKYENLLKLYESRRGALMGANGGLYLLRASEWRPLPGDTIVDDFLVSMRVVAGGRRLVYAPEAVATEETAVDLQGEFRRRVRIAAGNFQSLGELSPLLFRRDFAAFAFWSHKLLRWLAPAFLLTMLLANVALAGRPFYALVLAGQLAFYGAALLRTPVPGSLGRLVALARYFVEMNAALAVGFGRFLRGSQRATWQRTQRTPQRRAA